MDIILYSDGDTPIHRLDPRARVLAAALLTLFLSQAHDFRVLGAGCVVAILSIAIARVPIAAILQRLVPLNALLGLLAVMLLFTTPGERLFQVGPAVASVAGLQHGATILLKGNTIVALLAALIGTIEFVALGKALGQLRVPAKLVNVLLFTVRYINLMLAEYERMSQAALLRGFRPGPNRHTVTTTGYLIGMILVRSYDRGARMLQAMKLRGYDGTLAWSAPSQWRTRDGVFLVVTVALVAVLARVEWV